MNWKTASENYAHQLQKALNVQRFALDLANLSIVSQLGISSEQKAKLKQAGENAEKQMHRLKKGEFRIAVVGLEKAGKSTFVNAWLGSDLLPAKTARCTFTTTQIYSVTSDDEQRLVTVPKTQVQYQAYQDDLIVQSKSQDKGAAQNAEKDLKVMSQHYSTLQEILSEGKKTYNFSSGLEEIKPIISRYVADEKYAHAMQEVQLYTSKLAAVDGVVFYDVPGLDSGLAKHIEESKEMLADCDAIILVQRRDIDLKAHEQDLIKFGEKGDPYLKLADKLFVFWGQIDLLPSKEALENDWQQLLEKWKAFEIPEHRIVRGSAGADLVLQGYAIAKVGSLEQTQNKMQILSGLSETHNLRQATGIAELQKRIQTYLDNERTGLLEKRCNAMIQEILETATKIYQTVAAVYPEDPEQAKRAQDETNTLAFQDWWGRRWQKMRADVNNRFKDGSKISIQNRQAFRVRYQELVKEKINVIPSRQLDERQQIFDSVSNPIFDAAKSNIVWREKLYSDVRVMMRILSENLAYELQQEALEIIETLENQLWGSKRVKGKLIDNEKTYMTLLEHSLNTLFMRFARPVVDLLIRAPIGSDTRRAMRTDIGADIEIIDNYYSGGEPALEQFRKYASHGVQLLTDSKKRKEVLGEKVSDVIGSLIEITPYGKITVAAASMLNNEATPVNKQEAMIAEVEADIRVLEHYLIHGIFEAAGFSAFCKQELNQLRDSFLDDANVYFWNGVVQNEWKAGNAALLQELPPNLRSLEFNIETSERLKQLGIALKA